MIPTPKTDAAAFPILSDLQSGTRLVVDVEVARELERENAKLREQLRVAWLPRTGDVLLQSPLGTQQLACGNRVPVENPTIIRVQ